LPVERQYPRSDSGCLPRLLRTAPNRIRAALALAPIAVMGTLLVACPALAVPRGALASLRTAEAFADSGLFAAAESVAAKVLANAHPKLRLDEAGCLATALVVDARLRTGKSLSASQESLAWHVYARAHRPPFLPMVVRARVSEMFARIQSNHGDLLEGIMAAREAVTLLDNSSEGGTALTRALTLLGGLYLDVDDAAPAESALCRAISIERRTPGWNAHELAQLYGDFGLASGSMAHFNQAIDALTTSLRLETALGRGDSTDSALWLSHRGDALEKMNRIADAESDFRRSEAIWRNARGLDYPSRAGPLRRLGSMLGRLGSLVPARDALEEAVRILGRDLSHAGSLASSELELGNLYYEMGDCSGAADLYESSSELFLRPEVADTVSAANCLNNLGALALENRQYDSSAKMLLRSIELQIRSYRPTNTDANDLANSWQNLALAYRQAHETDSALVCFTRSRVARLAAPWPDSLEMPKLYYNLGLIAEDREEFALARADMDSALSILATRVPPGQSTRLAVLEKLAELEWVSGRPRAAFDQALKCEVAFQDAFNAMLPRSTERGALLLAGTRTPALDLAISIALERQEAGLTDRVWDVVVRYRGVVFDEIAQRHRRRHALSDPKREYLWTELEGAVERRAGLNRTKPESLTAGAYAQELRAARKEVESLQRKVAGYDLETRKREEQGNIGGGEVRAAVGRHSALVAFIRFQRFDPVSVRRLRAAVPGAARSAERNPLEPVPWYAAFVVGPNGALPLLLDLGSAGDLEPLVTSWYGAAAGLNWRGAISDVDSEHVYRKLATSLRVATWDKLAPRLRGAKEVYIVPDGQLHMVAFETLPAGRQKYLIESAPTLIRLASERDLVSLGRVLAIGNGFLGVGAVDYDQVDSIAAQRYSRALAESGAARYREKRAGCQRTDPIHFDSLSQTGAEVDSAAQEWRLHRERDERCDVVRGGAATGSVFRALAPGRRGLHVATHSFIITSRCRTDQRRVFNGSIYTPCSDVLESPLVESGLVFAGANHVANDTEGFEGLLSGEEIASLELSGMEIAVLSACGTGLGPVRSGEGIFNLSRSFQLAGCREVVSTLWPVDDRSTEEWMRAFYKAYFRKHSSADAVRQASLQILKDRRTGARCTHPLYWGAFESSRAEQ